MQKTIRSRAFAAALLYGAAALMGASTAAAAPTPKLTRSPSLSLDSIAFLHADDIWIAPRNGGTAIRLTTDGKARGGPVFSPDGQEIAYAAQASGNSTDIFVVPAKGGVPRRVTWHPDSEAVAGWTPDGKDIVFASARAVGVRSATQLFRTAADGEGAPIALPLPLGQTMSFSPDATKVAYTPLGRRSWKGYRGGTAPYIWIADLKTLDVVKVPHTDASDWNPMWIGGKVYFLSDRDGPIGLYAFDVATNAVTRVLENTGAFEFQSAQAGPGGIVIDALDSLKLFDPATAKVRTIAVKIPDAQTLGARKVDLPGRRAVTKALSPDGSTYAIEARGEIFVAPNGADAKARNLTETPAIAERAPTWSPDGKQLAYVSDASGEYRLVVRTPGGADKPQVFGLGAGHGVFTDFHWSPDGRRIAFVDETTTIWMLDLSTGKSAKVAHDLYGQGMDIAGWSPDGRTLAYVTRNRALVGVVWLYDVAAEKSTALTDGRADAFSPAFDPAGGKIYFLASSDKPMASTASLASNGVPYTAGAYVADLADLARPVIQRLSAPPREYRSLQAGEHGAVYLSEGGRGDPHTIWRVANGKTDAFVGDVQSFGLVMGGKAAVIRRKGEEALVQLADIKPGADGLAGTAPAGQPFTTPALPITVDPRAEWKQIYHEAWRLQRDLFYAGHYNGLDIVKAEARYAPFVAGVDSRGDLTYLLREAFSELRASHMNVADPPRGDPSFGAEGPAPEPKTAGLLGADYATANGRYRFARIYRGDVWLTEAPGPLAQTGIDVKEGDYLIAVNGKELHADDNLDRAFEGLAGKPTEIKVSADPSGASGRTYKVTPTGNEFAVRHAGWIADNKKKVDALSGGKLAYVYVINTGDEGYAGFNTQYLSQTDKAGVVVDERNNGGGPVADFIVERLKRQPLVQVWPRYAETSQPFPADFIDGPAAMIINENAGSGGDILPYMFRKAKAGPIIGKRSWGGTVGGGSSPSLLDGGTMTIPHFPISDPDGTWGGLEGNGVTPDVVVDQEPKLVAAGHDPQLEAAVKAVMDQIAANPTQSRKPPPSRETLKGGHGG
jgi:tricorn protease